MGINMSYVDLFRAKLRRVKTLIVPTIVAAGALVGGPAYAASVITEDWITGLDAATRVLVIKPDQATGAVMLLPGGYGNIDFDVQAHISWSEDDFLLRTRMDYANAGLLAIVPDVANDHKPPTSLTGFRTSPMQANDLHALVDHLRSMTPRVWMVAYDSGATSALNAAARGKADSLAGLVLISPILEEPEPASSMLIDGAKLALASLPVLLITHESDSCSRPAVDRIKNAAAALKAPSFHSITIKGGIEQYSVSNPFDYPKNRCSIETHHSLAGREAVVSRNVIDWLNQQSAAAK
jgi:pimeloyl-ACP methyl ester carboxylesterase